MAEEDKPTDVDKPPLPEPAAAVDAKASPEKKAQEQYTEGTTVSEEVLPSVSDMGTGFSLTGVNGYLTHVVEDEEEVEGEKPFSYIDFLDKPRSLPSPIILSLEDLKQISNELGLIKLCWPKISDPVFENRTNFPDSYVSNTDKEKLLLLYTENFRQQYCFKHPRRKPLLLACENECGVQKMVCTTIRPTTLAYHEMQEWQDLIRFVGDHLKYEPLEEPTLIPRRLCSPHTVFQRQSGHSFEVATALCSLLIGLGYDAYVVSGYAIRDVTTRIMSRVDCPYPPVVEEEEKKEEAAPHEKYKLRSPKDLRSQFLLMMEQREIDKVKEEEEKLAQIEKERLLEEETRSFDELEGQRIHAWILLKAGPRDIQENVFIEPSSALVNPVDSPLYCGIESIWNNTNYWVNMQDCTEGLDGMEYDLTDVTKWEHLLVGEPIHLRKQVVSYLEEEEEGQDVWQEKHLDMPMSWSTRIHIPHHALKTRFPEGVRMQMFKRTCVEEYAPYVCMDGLVARITRFKDFDCLEIESSDERYENRVDKLVRSVFDLATDLITDYHGRGRDDKVIKHIYYKNKESEEDCRTIIYNSKGRSDSLAKIEVAEDMLTEYYENRDDKMCFRQTTYVKKADVAAQQAASGIKSSRRPIEKILQKFDRNEDKHFNDDIAVRTFLLQTRHINLKFHYGKGHVTASTRTFIKPPLAEMGDGMVFRPELTYGYQADVGAKPIRAHKLFMLFETQLKEEEMVINSIRGMEDQIKEFLIQRAHELAFPKLDIPLFNVEQNDDFRRAMLEREEALRMYKEKEVEVEEVNYIAPYLARLNYPDKLSENDALKIIRSCLEDFRNILVYRANVIQQTFEKMSENLAADQTWYTVHHDCLTPEEESAYFEKVNNKIFYMRVLEIRLDRLKQRSTMCYDAMEKYVRSHPLIEPVIAK